MAYEHLSAICAVSSSSEGRLIFSLQQQAYKTVDIVEFLSKVRRKLGSKLLIIWDGATIHRAKAIKQYLAKGSAKHIRLERLPAYAPELNPAEGVWHWLKQVALANCCLASLGELQVEVSDSFARLRRKNSVVQKIIAYSGSTV